MKLAKLLLIGAAALIASAPAAMADATVREHRAIWMTPFLSGNWPSSAITEANANSHKNILIKRLAKFKDQNVNILYYHCRAMCDATYESSYEPWSKNVSGTRGVAPAFDPFGFLVQEAHNVGIEVYAWINPYRYCSTSKYGAGELNYENFHPEWLLSQQKETILNPALEEVKQRIVDVVSEIVTKYDVDGVIFDDYFYTSGTPMSLDAADYKKYTSAGGKLSQADWRRANVNDMVARVNAAIKKIKPWVTFGISPAGVASPPTVESEYGLPAAPGGGDWQYNGIYSDPLAWFKAGSIDFMSPQIYWTSRFDGLSQWWSNAAMKFGRHCYPSVDISDITTIKYAEFAREIEQSRAVSPAGTSGLVFFQYYNFVNYYERFNNKSTELGYILAQDVWNTKALVPLRPWIKSPEPTAVSNVAVDGQKLTWAANDGGRYAIYRQPATQSTVALELAGISYTNSYDMGDEANSYSWYVATYDRYGKLATPISVGGQLGQGTAPQLTYPAEGERPVDLFEFSWNHSSTLRNYTVEVAEDRDFAKMTGSLEVQGANSVSVSGLPTLTEGKTYYWRVKATDVDRVHPVSETRSFVASRIAMTSPAADAAEVAIEPTMTWTAAVDGAQYTVEISRQSDLTNPVLVETVGTTSFKVPARVLNSGRKYYARVTARKGDASSTSDIINFATVNRTDYAAPTFVNPATDGATLHVDEVVRVAPWDGMNSINVQIATTTSFPSRTSYSVTLSDFATDTPELGTIKVSSKALVDGTTYYLRARGVYSLTTSTASQYTDWTPVRAFVYSAQAGVDDITADNAQGGTYIEGTTTLHVADDAATVAVYTLTGALVRLYNDVAGHTIDLSDLAPGAYLIQVGNTALKYIR